MSTSRGDGDSPPEPGSPPAGDLEYLGALRQLLAPPAQKADRWMGHGLFASAFLLVGLAGVVMLTTQDGDPGDWAQALNGVLVVTSAAGLAAVGLHARSELSAAAAAVVQTADLRAAASQLRSVAAQVRRVSATSAGSVEHPTTYRILDADPRSWWLYGPDEGSELRVEGLAARLGLHRVAKTVAMLVRSGRAAEAVALREAAREAAVALEDVARALRGDGGEDPREGQQPVTWRSNIDPEGPGPSGRTVP